MSILVVEYFIHLFYLALYLFGLFVHYTLVDPAFWLMRFPLDDELDFYFEKLILFD